MRTWAGFEGFCVAKGTHKMLPFRCVSKREMMWFCKNGDAGEALAIEHTHLAAFKGAEKSYGGRTLVVRAAHRCGGKVAANPEAAKAVWPEACAVASAGGVDDSLVLRSERWRRDSGRAHAQE